MGTPQEVSDAMDRTWEVFLAPERIVEDILRFPVALQRIKDVKGAVVPEMDNHKGRRVISQLPYQPSTYMLQQVHLSTCWFTLVSLPAGSW